MNGGVKNLLGSFKWDIVTAALNRGQGKHEKEKKTEKFMSAKADNEDAIIREEYKLGAKTESKEEQKFSNGGKSERIIVEEVKEVPNAPKEELVKVTNLQVNFSPPKQQKRKKLLLPKDMVIDGKLGPFSPMPKPSMHFNTGLQFFISPNNSQREEKTMAARSKELHEYLEYYTRKGYTNEEIITAYYECDDYENFKNRLVLLRSSVEGAQS